ncbi:hypothetical protein [Piscibacillus halophilus]|uniref:Uncharacterized protein n=2 Tax=Piscibacillus halophilus TaxID=571933 RepID=A0A1H9K3V4_9BACI|nr:hypothetical protein [Piscibacillus halophilus]SEQ93593.1 hypothetical protein SAMN05216362_13517 [Piscibacillus halophilus]
MTEKSQVLQCENFQGSWTSAGNAIFNTVKFNKDDLNMVRVMGYTGHAFRININAADVDVAGPTAYDWEDIFAKGLENLGFKSETIRTLDFVAPTPDELKRAISMIQKSIDQGVPAISWDLFVPEFGNIFGYDDEKKTLWAIDPQGDQELPYEKLGRGQVNELFVAIITEEIEVDRETMFKTALDMAINHAYHREHKDDVPPYENGLKGYDAWIEAFEKGEVSEFGNAYNIHVVHDARNFAAQFFRELKDEWQNYEKISTLCDEAVARYQEVTDHLRAITNLYPFPQGGEPNKPENAQFTIEQLKLAKQSEVEAVKVLERIREQI